MFPFQNPKSSKLPLGFFLELNEAPTAQELNRLLSRCNADTYSSRKLSLALNNSYCNLSILQDKTFKLFGFVRITSDKGLNANLWDLVAAPGDNQKKFLAVLIHHALAIIRKDLPGCSVSVSAPIISIRPLEEEGFIIDPSGIRTMAYRIR
ncbi:MULTISPECIES: GNAT family acetyltransferase [Prochlorococcus]|uniref:GNAT family acetyltransferase n=1 Tax=Prochlorococcus marinus (strain SARG / CCMP1375 / SS120) TaxID=167539 RepID=Q7V9U5_PROMA|nr:MULTISPECIES: GNAT family acetyltransferase [Prochlorococcus]AAQ00773.1 GNAT family acetyltransferase [Prochlorococcus marinus subsp. marinus str. CCMP1375]KGG10732.1 GNAT family acetyltransferase [Prochlorococcus marinus str. LG]KGG21154.1 GNAT family acetyltransferase [Prochlorococcus marinus str. SS2]KGG23978.1 GNAT family acetyltransferase [Prochlorococcus marinus str. SS35]KGG31762.1 GNAT family acetyltransferase [Prochlorococcus marinus str. SS51]